MGRGARVPLLMFVCLVFVPAAAYAQASITGVVKDTSGAVLPGVTVEAASPVLIERTRSVITSETGQYRIENLRPGVYSVTFTLPGFNTVQRTGIELSGTFTASVNADLSVGVLAETVTVTGETPVVDVQSATVQRVLDRELIHTIPTSRNAAVMAALIPAVRMGNQDVGGVVGESFSSAGGVTVHGNADVRTQVNGLSVHSAQGNGATGVGNIAAFQEMAVDTSTVSAEHTEGGVRMNLVPREGGNTFGGSLYVGYATNWMQADNFAQDLKDRGLRTPNTLKRYLDFNPSFGGPLKRDRLWFHVTARYNGALNYAPIFFNKNAGNPNVWTYEPDTSRRATNDAIWKGINARITWQATPKNKFALAYDLVDSCQCPRVTPTVTPEGAQGSYAFLRPKDMIFVDWTATVTNRLLLEASLLRHREHAQRPSENRFLNLPPGAPKLIQVTEQRNNLTYRASGDATDTWNRTWVSRVAMSYVTGAHSFKVGFNYDDDHQDQWRYNIDSPMSFRFNNGVPNRLTLQATPFRRIVDLTKRGLFVQDKWTVRRLTLTGGLRYDYLHASFPAVTIGPGEFTPNRNFVLPATDGVRWHDLEPRAGLAVDVFGNGKTSLKVSLNKYLYEPGLPNSGGTFTTSMAPSFRLVRTTNRSWRDANRNFVPDCNLIDPLDNGECGPMDNPDFGTTRLGVAYDPDTLRGWGKRESNWQFSAGIQRELMARVSMDVSYFRTWFGNLVVTDNRALSPADFDTFSITAPADPRLPGGGGYEVSGLYDVKPNKFAIAADNYITFANNFGKQIQHWNGVDITINARAWSGVTFQGGTSTGRTTTDNCDIVDDLPEILFAAQNVGEDNANAWSPASNCHQQSKFLTLVKFLGTYTLPRIDVQLTATVQSVPGPQIVANYVATNAIVAPRLGRNLAGTSQNMTVNIVEPGTMYGERMNQLDLRIGKNFNFEQTRTTISLDLYNALNANPVLTQSNAYGTWQRPQSILNPRFAKIVLQFNF